MLNFRHPVVRFLEKTMGLVQIIVTITNHDFGLDYKLHEPKLHRSPPSECTLYWKFFHRSRFWVTCACPEKTELPWNFSLSSIYVYIKDFLQLALALETELPWNFSLYCICFSPFRIFEQLALALKNGVCTEFIALNIYFLLSGVLRNFACPEKQSAPWNF